MAKSVNMKRLELRIDAFTQGISRLGYSICKVAQGKYCSESNSNLCAHLKKVKGIQICNL